MENKNNNLASTLKRLLQDVNMDEYKICRGKFSKDCLVLNKKHFHGKVCLKCFDYRSLQYYHRKH